ncbi:MAG: hypothetical protein KGI27_14925, partial [Thaumarchaeota archaeon]|nr:hypothetical protein [Nitrososphaerota archaeon]
MNGVRLTILAITVALSIYGLEYWVSFNPAHAELYEKTDQNRRFYNFSVAWQGANYSIPAWITNGNITGIRLYPGGEQLNLQLEPYGNGMVRVKLPRDIFEHGPVGLANFVYPGPDII